MKTVVIPIILIILFSSLSEGQILKYEILLGQKPVGTLEVSPTNLKSDNYAIKMDAQMSFPFMKVSSVFDVQYQNGVLWQSAMVQKSNDKIREQSTIIRKGDTYQMNIDGKSETLAGKVTYSITKLYHFEPKGIKRVFSERYGEYATIAEIAPHHYELLLPDGKTNQYRYENGICVEMTASYTLSKVTFQLMKNGHAAGR